MINNRPVNCDILMTSEGSNEDMSASSQEDNRCTVEKSIGPKFPECSKLVKSNLSSDINLSSKDDSWQGTSLHLLPINTTKDQFPAVFVGPQHSVLFKLPVKEGEVPQTWPEKPVDVWDQNHVRMPHSAMNLQSVTLEDSCSPLSPPSTPKWELIQKAFSTTISTSQQLEAAILSYNSEYHWDVQGLHSFFSEALEDKQREDFFSTVLPKIIELALRLPTLVINAIPLLRQRTTHSISFTQQQISCLLANAFLCTFPCRSTSQKDSEYSTFPTINFNRLFSGTGVKRKDRTRSFHEKLKCLINYFRRVTNKVPDGVVTYSRHYIAPDDLPVWSNETIQLPNMYISSSGTIEDEGTGMVQVDFANKKVGGSVLGCGCVQEEIRFVICPELILARLFTEVLDDTEALIVTGCERFNMHRGYANSFEWTGDYQDTTPRDSFGRRFCSIVAIDALRFPNPKTQHSPENINRELNKAYVGFSWGSSSGCRESVATGNWGCGAFRGDACLKSLLQLMAAAKSGRDLAYFSFGQKLLQNKIADMHSFLVQHQVILGYLWKVISSYNPILYRHSLYDHIYEAINTKSIPEPSKKINSKNLNILKNNSTKKQEAHKRLPTSTDIMEDGDVVGFWMLNLPPDD